MLPLKHIKLDLFVWLVSCPCVWLADPLLVK